jgi:hypothetical protein
MTTTLIPRNGKYLSPMDVITRLQPEFAYVEISEEGARSHVLELIEQFKMAAEETGVADVADYIGHLERAQHAARFIHFGNDLGADGVCLSMLMIPRQPLFIDAHAEDEETWFLIFRCADVLGYEVFEPDTETAEPALDYAPAAEDTKVLSSVLVKNAGAKDHERRAAFWQN